MTDEMTPPAPIAPARGRGWLKGCGAALLILLLVFVIARVRAGSALDARLEGLKGEIATFKASLPAERPVVFGAPDAGNAVDHYRAIEWILGPATTWDKPPTSVTPLMEKDHPTVHGLKVYETQKAGNDALQKDEPLPPEVVELLATYAPCLQHVRDGLRQGRCEWGLNIEDGVAAEIPQLLPYRLVANLMAFEAEGQEPVVAARTCLQVVALGRDLGRDDTMIAAMIGVAVRQIGVRALERLLRTRALPRAAYEDAIATLAAVGPCDVRRPFVCERLGFQAELAHLAGRGLSTRARSAEDGVAELALLRTLGPIYIDWEWGGYLRHFDAFDAAEMATPAEREARAAAAMAELEASWSILAKIAIPNLARLRQQLEASNALVDAARLLAAAHLHRLDTGAFPQEAAPLAKYLGGALPADPFRKEAGPLTLKVVGDEVRCYSVGDDGKDDGGAGHGETDAEKRLDEALITRAPPS